LLKRHQLFVNLLKLLKGGVASYDMLTEAFARNMPSASKDEIRQVLDVLLVLMAWALREGNQPLVTLRVQVWVRELRRMVGKLAADSEEVMLRSERDLPGERDGVYLPMVQCRQCRTTGGFRVWCRAAASCPRTWRKSITPGSRGAGGDALLRSEA
jgi:DEAD/DEAH box helicase domain-containing protein